MIEQSCVKILNYTHKNVLSVLLSSIYPLMKLALHVHIKISSGKKKSHDLTKRPSMKDEAKRLLEEKSRRKDNSIQDLCMSFITILCLFIYNLSNNGTVCEVTH